MSSRTFYTLVLFDMIFLGFLFLYDAGLNPNPQFGRVFDDIFGPWPQYNSGNCQVTSNWTDFFANSSCLSQQTIGALFWLTTLIGSFFFRIGAFGTLVIQVVAFSFPTSASSVPFLPYILIAFQIIIVMDAVTVFRGSSSGV